jgi:hypothetical protein
MVHGNHFHAPSCRSWSQCCDARCTTTKRLARCVSDRERRESANPRNNPYRGDFCNLCRAGTCRVPADAPPENYDEPFQEPAA